MNYDQYIEKLKQYECKIKQYKKSEDPVTNNNLVMDILWLTLILFFTFFLWCFRIKRRKRRAVGLNINFTDVQNKEVIMAEGTITNKEKGKVIISPVDDTGAPAPIEGPVVAAIVTGDCTYEQIDDTSFWIISGDTVSDSLIEFSADADLGAGVESISNTLLVHVVAPRAKNLNIVFSDVQPK